MRDPTSPTAAYHRKTYGELPYAGFQQRFEREVAGFDADHWAQTFQRAGADYVVMVAKYHDGYALWPTRVPNPHAPGWHSHRDLVGAVAAAVRARGMRFGLYYSGGVDWTFQHQLVRTLGDYSYLPYGDGYGDYAEAQVRELIQRYRPDLLWNDIAWPTGQQRLNAIFADYYNTVPDGVVNDRWQTDSLFRRLMGLAPARGTFDLFFKQVLARDPGIVERITPPKVPHADFTTPEYTQYPTTQDFVWETTRGMGTSYGFNRQETEDHYASFERTLFPEFVAAVAKNGQLLLNVGPAGGNGRIPPSSTAGCRRSAPGWTPTARPCGAPASTKSPGPRPPTACRCGSPRPPAASTPSSSGAPPAPPSGSRVWRCRRGAGGCWATAARSPSAPPAGRRSCASPTTSTAPTPPPSPSQRVEVNGRPPLRMCWTRARAGAAAPGCPPATRRARSCRRGTGRWRPRPRARSGGPWGRGRAMLPGGWLSS
jgi:alpha-L-fucosidase